MQSGLQKNKLSDKVDSKRINPWVFDYSEISKGTIINEDIIKGKWEQLKGKAKEKWGELTNDDLDIIEGKRDQLAGKIREKYGRTKEEAEKEIDDWLNGQD